MNTDTYKSLKISLKKYNNTSVKTAFAFGYLQSACSSSLYTREEIRELADLIQYELDNA